MKTFFKSSGFTYAFIAAFLFGASTPLSKLLLAKTNPWFLAGILYLGAGIGILILMMIRSLLHKNHSQVSLTQKDIPWLVGTTFFGGILAPVLLMHGLITTEAASASLFLNTEVVFTVLIAWFIFKERFNRRIFMGIFFIVLGGFILSWVPHPSIRHLVGPFFIVGACLCWGIDNNITRKISASDPLQITIIKSLVAGATNLFLGIMFHAQFSSFSVLLITSILGFLSYGLSLLCFILALRYIGTSRAGALFSLAPFVGTGLSVLFLGESFSVYMGIAAVFMAVGVGLFLSERHSYVS